MPNWVTNLLTITGAEEQINQVIEAIAGEPSEEDGSPVYIDFNRIIPMPKDLLISAGSVGADGVAYITGKPAFKTQEEFYALWDQMTDSQKDEALLLGAKYLANIARYGVPTWYEWSCNHWDTKWNACDTDRDGNVIRFDTAWSTPKSVIEELSRQFPEVVLEIKYADEDLGYNVGNYSYQAGELMGEEKLGGTAQGFELAFQINGGDEDYELIDGEYRRKEW